MDIGIGIDTQSFRLRAGYCDDEFELLPGIIEEGVSSPPQVFRYAVADSYFVWHWLCFRVYFARALNVYREIV